MVIVELRLNSLALSSHMADLRLWLDRSRAETAGFSHQHHIDNAFARVAVKVKAEAEAFAAHFTGRVILTAAAPRRLPGSPPPPTARPVDRSDTVAA